MLYKVKMSANLMRHVIMSAESPRHIRSGGPVTVPSQPPSDRSIIDAVSGFINDVTLSSSSNPDPKDTIQWARFESADINEPTPDGDNTDISPILLILGYGSGVQVWLIPPNGEAQEVLSWRQGTVRVLRILPTPQNIDSFASKRPLIALCDSASPGPTFCSLSFISIRGGEQVKSIKFKNQILDVLANKRSIVVSFSERFAVFDAGTLEDRMAVTTCYPCPCPLGGNSPINPLALGDRWLAYADKKINPSKRSSGGCEGEGVASYTATVLHAAKSLGKGLRGLGESVAQSLGGGGRGASPPQNDANTPGVVTILDLEGNNEDDTQDSEEPYDPIVAHFIAHSEAIIAMKLDASGVLLVTADRRGHDFHVFRINPHPCGPSLASVHHLYILHRGDTTAKVQDIAISPDSRWTAISTLRGTTHIFPISPYGGSCGVRTHTTPRVVNRLSRFHRSAGLPIHSAGSRAPSPVSEGLAQGAWFPNPRLPPYPQPTTVSPLAQLRPTANLPTHTITRTSSGRQRLSSLSEESNSAPLLARARFGACGAAGAARGPAQLALYLMAANGQLLHLLLQPRHHASIPKEKVCDDSPIELEVEAVAQWPLQRAPPGELLPPLPAASPLLQPAPTPRYADICLSEEERWLAQVEIVTHAGPHRRLWMGPQFVFKTYTNSGSNSSLSEAEAVEVDTHVASSVARSNPVNMPAVRPPLPVLIDSGSASSLEHSPCDSYRRKSLLAETGRAASVTDVQLREDLAEAMKEDQGIGWPRGDAETREEKNNRGSGITRAVDPLGTVVVPSPGPEPVVDDPDLYTHCNDDEASFRPVVRAPAYIPQNPNIIVRPLPLDTRIPVQTFTPIKKMSPENEPLPLTSDVVIPAALTCAQNLRDDCALPTNAEDQSQQPVDEDKSILDKPIDKVEHKETDVNKDLKCEETNVKASVRERERKSAETDVKTLPKSNQPDDIQSAVRVKKSPTPKLISYKDSETSVKSTKRKVCAESKNDRKKSEEIFESTLSKNGNREEIKKSKHSKNKIDQGKSTSAAEERKFLTECTTNDAKEETINTKNSVDAAVLSTTKTLKNIDDTVNSKCLENLQYGEEICVEECVEINKLVKDVVDRKEEYKYMQEEIKNPINEEQTVSVTLKRSAHNTKSLKNKDDVTDVKSEEQVWDLLLNETSKGVQAPSAIGKSMEEKIKSKRNRKNKRMQEEFATKADEDSFVEIHTIDEKSQVSTGDLVSISLPYDDSEASRLYFAKRKTRSPKSITPDRTFQYESKESIEKSFDMLSHGCKNSPINKSVSHTHNIDDIEVVSSDNLYTAVEFQKTIPNATKFEDATKFKELENKLETQSQNASLYVKESCPSKEKKSKSLSPFLDNRRKHHVNCDQKELIVIDSSKDDFPEIQITRGIKNRKKSPQPTDMPADKELVIETPPVKSWSSIAASKNIKKLPEPNISDAGDTKSSKEVSLQDKLFELCKRTDIVVAECDAPSELNFVEEHHVLQDLPPLEELDFTLDDFKLETMRDSLLEVNDTKLTSPICKINIDDILFSIKETTSKVIESSTFNLVDLEKVPMKKEKGFSVIENEKITTQEVDLKMVDDKQQVSEIMEKSSDEDNTSPVTSTDSDKDEKKNVGASNLVQPSIKQSAKSKKTRRKKK